MAAAVLAAALYLDGQGIVTGHLPAQPKGRRSGRPFAAHFLDVATEAGLTARSAPSNASRKQYIIEANGAGVAFLDADGDGLLDVLLPNGSGFSAPDNLASTHLYRNLGNGKFLDVSQAAGVRRSGWGNGVCTGDIDNDGHEDFYLTYWGRNSLYRNLGGRFADIAVKAGVAGPEEEWNSGCTFVDYDRDGKLDLLVAAYAGFDPQRVGKPGSSAFCRYKDRPVFCGPRGLPFGRLRLYRNLGGGTFSDVSSGTGIGKVAGIYAFTTVAADFNRDGWTDIYVACDSTPSLLLRNNRDGTFREVGIESGVAYNENGTEQAGMGVAVGDFDRDGWPDIVKTNFVHDYPNLYRNLGKAVFEDLSVRAGLGVNPQHVLWGAGLEDFDNDGWPDVFQVSGHVYADAADIDPQESYRGPRLIYRKLGEGRYEDVSELAGPAVSDPAHSSRGAAFGDFDNDGDVDVLVMNMGERPSLLRNELKSPANWLTVELQGSSSNRSAIGATVTLVAGGVQWQAVRTSQSSFLSANDPRLHFGLGTTARVDRIAVDWPSGKQEEFPGTDARRHILLVEGSSRIQTPSARGKRKPEPSTRVRSRVR